MAFDDRSLNDYIDVAQRIADFREQYPHGSLQPLDAAKPWEMAIVNGVDKQGKEFAATMIVYVAAAYRTPDDPRPGIGMAWEVFPGRTPYTAGSELQNAETAAWGRAIVAALASDSKRGVSSREEVRNRQAEREPEPASNGAPQRTRTKTTGPEHERLVQPSPEERVNGRRTTRTRGPVPDAENTWQDNPPANGVGGRLAGIRIHFDRLGIKDRDERLRYTADLTGHAVTTSKELTDGEQKELLDALQKCKNRAALDAMRKQEVST